MHDSRIVPVFQALAEDVHVLGVRVVFGLMSDDTAVFAVTLDGLGVRFVGARHENNAIAMAEGYAYATGELGVALIGRGPATANGLHAAVAASRMGSKVLVIYGDAAVQSGAVNTIGPDYKGFNAQAVLGAAGLTCFTAASPATARQTLRDAVAAANQGSLAALLLPTNVQMMNVEVSGEATPPPVVTAQPAGARGQSIAAAVALLGKSRRPLIVAGMGAHRAGAKAALVALAEKAGALLMTSARGKDMFHGHPYNLGILGSFSHTMGRRMMDQADCVLVFGAGLNFLTMSFGAAIPPVPLIQVDTVRAHIGRWTTADVAVVGDARVVAEQLRAALPERRADDRPFHGAETLASIAAFDITRDFEAAHTARTVDPRALGVELDTLLPRDRNVVYDAGNFLGVLPYLTVPTPGHLKMTSEFASIGLGFGTALGVAKGRPGTPTVLIIGDGGFLMTMSELETAIREDLPLIIVLMNDCAYGAELHFLAMRKLPVGKSVFPDVDFASVAEAFGFRAYTIRTLGELRALGPVLSKPDGPILLDCKVNAEIAAPFMGEFAEFEARHQ
ncbi:MAG: thiamine pyrophosphate-binding protein [Candidatus Rokubacteria bacterium]|nr:thiamine pyrophosphate-binding protein [Candidatus Rokubacteria bacterium]